MIAAVRSEWIKFRTLTSSWVMVGLALGIPLIIVVLTSSFADGYIRSDDMAVLIAGTGVVSALLLGTVGILSITSEFGTNTIRPTFAALPDRWRPLLAKPAVQVTVTVVVMATIVVLGWIGGSAIADGDQSLGDDGVGAVLVGILVLAVLLTVGGYGLGLLVRNTPVAICILLLWPLLVEGILAGLFDVAGWDGLVRWLPYQAGFNLIEVDPSPDRLGRVPGGLWFGLWVVVLAGLGMWRTHRRDA
ncbi:MAG: hypothetical protein ACK5OX_06910 [Desertimonas sp.]